MTKSELLQKFLADIDRWTLDVFNQRSGTDAVTRKRLNKWLSELRPLFYSGMLGLNQKTTFDKLAGLGVSAKIFEEAFKRQVTALSSVDLSKASFLERTLKAKFKKGWKKFYEDYDVLVNNYPAKPLREVQKIFLKSSKNQQLKFESSYYRNGKKVMRNYDPKAYASMYARTRSAEVADTLMLAQMKSVGSRIVFINDAGTVTPICTLYENKYFSLDGTKGLPRLEFSPPFHPNCRHMMLAVREEDISSYIRHNRKQDVIIKAKQSAWTDAERRQVEKQKEWLRKNRPVK